MTSRIRLEPEVQAFADAAAKTPFLFTLGPQKGRIVLEEAQAGQVSTVPVDIEDFTIADGPSGQVPLRILRPQHAHDGELQVSEVVHSVRSHAMEGYEIAVLKVDHAVVDEMLKAGRT